MPILLWICGFLFFAMRLAASPGGVFELRDHERIVLVGDTLIEREQAYGEIEARITSQFPAKKIIVRNLGWSADTPTGISRASFDFDKPGKSFELLKEQIAEAQPTLIVFGYGMASSFDGKEGVERFRSEFKALIDAVEKQSTNAPMRFVFLSPVRHEDISGITAGRGGKADRLKPELQLQQGEVEKHNASLRAYAEVIKGIASAKEAPFISLMDLHGPAGNPLTENGIHLSREGYRVAAQTIANELGWGDGERIAMAVDQKPAFPHGVEVLSRSGSGVSFRSTNRRLGSTILSVNGLKRGKYRLRIDGVDVAEGSDRKWREGIAIQRGPDTEQCERLRQIILKKNELCFERYRPQNETYLFGFRKHEQGQNAKEIPMFDPLIAAQEEAIERLRQPRVHTYEVFSTRDAAPAYHSEITMESRSSPAPLRQDSAVEFGEQPNFETGPGVQVSLYAESPLLAKPIQMNFDPQGRLWVASSSVYPQVQPGQSADDKIIVLEDVNGDGRAEKSTVFAEGLLIPTAVIPGDGGAYVGQSTELLHFADTNRDGKADAKRIVLSAFGTEDTHHMVHTLRWGMDGQLYFDQSIYIHTHIETPHGVRRLNSGGVWRFRPESMDLSVFLRGFCNPWGHAFDEYGQSFVTDGAGFQGISYGLPGGTYFTYASMRREMPGISPGSYPKFCGLELIQSPAFPDDWQGNAVTCDFRAHRIVRFGIEEKGAGYAAHEVADVLRTTNVTFRPIDVKLGPDGALYVADWSNPIIQHGEVDFRDPRRDHEHGRIWRITFKDQPVLKRKELTKLSNIELMEMIAGRASWSANKQTGGHGATVAAPTSGFDQQQARRVLLERGAKTVMKDLGAWTRSQTNEYALMQALWLYQGIDVPRRDLLQRVLRSNDGRMRAAGVRVAAAWRSKVPDMEKLLAEAIADEHPRVRLEGLRALAEIPDARAAALALSVLEKPMDSFLDYALWLTINDLAEPWATAVKAGSWTSEGKEKQLEFALKAIEPAMATDILRLVLARGKVPADGSGPWIELVGSAGDSDLLQKMYSQLLEGGFSVGAQTRVLSALDKAARDRGVKPANYKTGLLEPFIKEAAAESKHEEAVIAGVKLIGSWQRSEYCDALVSMALSADAKAPLRQVALDSLREIGGERGLEALRKLSATAGVAPAALSRLAALDIEQAVPLAASVVTNGMSETKAEEFWRGWLGVKKSGQALARALPVSGLPAVVAKAGLRIAREGGRNEPELVWALGRGAGLEDESQTLSAEELTELAAKAAREGKAARGEKVFRRKELACVTCHAIGGVGGKVGPDLTSIGASAQPDYLVESVLYPNRKIKEGYHTVRVETKDGMDYSGVLASENQEQLVLRDATGKEITIGKKDIEQRTTGGSLMPAGLVDALAPGERLDLFKFLSELGKPGPFDASKSTVARSWRILVQTLDLAQFRDDRILAMDQADKLWVKENTLVDGTLLKTDFIRPFEELRSRDPRAIYLASDFEVPKAEPVMLQFEGPQGWTGWIDGKSISAATLLQLELSPGRHTFIARLNADQFPESLRLASPDVTFLNN